MNDIILMMLLAWCIYEFIIQWLFVKTKQWWIRFTSTGLPIMFEICWCANKLYYPSYRNTVQKKFPSNFK